MRLFILLAAAAVAVLNATKMNRIELDKFEDGTLITFWFDHHSNPDSTDLFYKEEPVRINFFNTKDLVDPAGDMKGKLLAHLRIGGKKSSAVLSSFFNDDYTWKEYEQPAGHKGGIDINLPTDQIDDNNNREYPFWRVDVFKHDDYTMSVFFQGYWSGVRFFKKPLGAVKSISLHSDFVDHHKVQIYVKSPNSKTIPTPPSWKQVDVYMTNSEAVPGLQWNEFIDIKSLPETASIEMSAILRASEPSYKQWTASLEFWPVGGSSEPFFRIVHIWTTDNQLELWLTSIQKLNYYMETSDKDDLIQAKTAIKCEESKRRTPHGDFQHFLLTRKGAELTLRTYFHPTEGGQEGLECKFTIPKHEFLDKPFQIKGGDEGAIILHLETDATIMKAWPLPDLAKAPPS